MGLRRGYNLRESLTHVVQGLLMGAADIVPGVSGGTIAFIVGIYPRLITAISHGFSMLTSLFKGRLGEMRRHGASLEWGLVLPLGAGIGAALLVGAKVIPTLLETWPYQTLGLFLGLVAGSVGVPWKRIERKSMSVLCMVVAACGAAFFLTGIPASGDALAPSGIRVFASAATAICAMILPGVSGAFLLKAMGMYEVTLHALNDGNLGYIALFACGAITGLGLFSRLLNHVLRQYADLTMAALVGLMIGALRALWPWQTAEHALRMPGEGEPFWTVILLAAAGFALITVMVRQAHRMGRPATGNP